MYEVVARCPVFKGISPVELEKLFAVIVFQLKNYKKGDIVALRDEPCNALNIIVQGMVKGEMVDFSGKVVKIEDIAAPRPIALAFIFGHNNRFPVDVTAQTDTQIVVIPRQSVVALMQQSEVFLTNYMNAISDRASFLSSRIHFLSFRTIKEKMAYYLLDISKPNKREVIIDKSQQELADYFAVTRPALARVITELVNEGAIEANRKNITILNRDYLTKLL